MAAISIAINRGNDGFRISDFTVGTAAPTGGTDMEFRFNTTDQGGLGSPTNIITRKDLTLALEAFIRAINSDAQFITPAGL